MASPIAMLVITIAVVVAHKTVHTTVGTKSNPRMVIPTEKTRFRLTGTVLCSDKTNSIISNNHTKIIARCMSSQNNTYEMNPIINITAIIGSILMDSLNDNQALAITTFILLNLRKSTTTIVIAIPVILTFETSLTNPSVVTITSIISNR